MEQAEAQADMIVRNTVIRTPDQGAEYSGLVTPYSAQTRLRSTWHKASFRSKMLWWIQGFYKAIKADLAKEQAFGHFFLWVPVCIGTGAIFWFTRPSDPYVATILLCAFLTGTIVVFKSGYRASGWHIGVILLFITLGTGLAALQTQMVNTTLLDSSVTTHLTGTVIDRERLDKGRWRYVLSVSSTRDPVVKRLPDTAVLVSKARGLPAMIGQSVTGLARLSPPSGPALPELNDFGFDAYFQGIGAVGYFYGSPEILPSSPLPVAGSFSQSFFNLLNHVRSSIGMRIQSILPGDTGAFATSIVTDERRAISKDTTEALRLSGLAHIVAISGLNMALASGIFFVGFRTVLSLSPMIASRFNIKKIAASGALLGLFAYYLISGAAVSAERAFIMMAVILIAVLMDRPALSLRNVAVSATIILVTNPSAIMGPSFQMSFAATLALVAGYHFLQSIRMPENPLAIFPFFRFLAPIVHFFWAILMTSAIGGASTAIFSMEHFHRVAAYGLPANLVAMPIVSFIVMPFGLIAMLLLPFGLDEMPLRVMGFGLDMTIAVAKYTASFGGNVLTGRLDTWFFPVAGLSFTAMCILRTRLRLFAVALFFAASVFEYASAKRPFPDLVVYEDGILAATVSNGQLNVTMTKPPDFVFTQIQYALGIIDIVSPDQVQALAMPTRAKGDQRIPLGVEQQQFAVETMVSALAVSEGQFLCAAKQWCATTVRNNVNIVIVQDPIFTGAACDVADLVIVPRWLPFKTCRSGALLITRDNLKKRGSLEITFPESRDDIADRPRFWEKTRIVGALDGVTRPWTKHRYYQWRTDRFDPPFDAQTINYSDE